MFAYKHNQNYLPTYGIPDTEDDAMIDNRTASERASKELDFVPHLHALLLFHEKIPLATLLHIRIFLTLVELCKANYRGIDMRDIRQYIPMSSDDPTKLIAESTLNRVLKTLSTGDAGFSYKGRERGFGLIEIVPLDGKRKKVTVTREGFEMASRMVDGKSIQFGRDYLDALIDSVERRWDYFDSDEMKYVDKLFKQGLAFEEVEKKVEAWRKANPDKIFVPRGTHVLTMIVPEEIDEDWLAAFQHENSTQSGRKEMLLQSGFPDDDLMESMMFLADYRSRGQVSLRVSRDKLSKNASKSILERVERIREINKDGKFVHSPLLQQIADKAAGKVGARKYLKVHTRMPTTDVDARTKNTADKVVAKTIEKISKQTFNRDEEFEAMKSEMIEMKKIIAELRGNKDVG